MLLLLTATTARADHETILIDGDLTDLINAVNGNLGPDQGGDICDDLAGEIGSGQCAYYINGYDIDNSYLFFDFLTPGGQVTTNVTLYAGWDQSGLIGDVDGDGSPDTYTFHPCASSDEAGIGPFESYIVDISTNCDGIPELRIAIKNNQVIDLLTTTPVPGATFAFVGDQLELRVPDLLALLPAGTSGATLRALMRSNSEFDQLAEDDCEPFQLDLPPGIEITKTPETQNACPGATVTWTITVTNTGLDVLNPVTVTDVLPTGLTFQSSIPGSTGDDHTRTWNLTLDPGASQQITLNATVDTPCAAPVMTNVVDVTGTPQRAPGCPPALQVSGSSTAIVNCSSPECSIDGPGSVCTGAQDVQYCGPAGMDSYAWQISGNGSIDGAANGQCVLVDAGAAGSYVLTLTVTDDGCSSTCETTVSVTTAADCSIAGPGSVCAGAEDVQFCGPDGMDSYSWQISGDGSIDGSTTGQCVLVDAGASGSFVLTLSVTDNGCSSTCQATVTVNEAPPCEIAGEDTLCSGSTDNEFCGPAGLTSYSWSIVGNGTIVGATDGACVMVTAGAAGSFTLTLVVGGPGDVGACSARCELTVTVEDCGANCPRTVGFWGQQCEGGPEGGNVKFSESELAQIAACVDDYSAFFDWADDYDGFCETIRSTGDQRLQAKRQFAGMLANICVGQLGLVANNGDEIFLDPNTAISCSGIGATTIEGLIAKVDSMLAALEGLPLRGPGGVGSQYGKIISCVDPINNGISVPVDCDGDGTGDTGRTFEADPSIGAGKADQMAKGATRVGPLNLYLPTPNPFTQMTRIAYEVSDPAGAQVEINVYDVSGRMVRQLTNGSQSTGFHEVMWDGRSEQGAPMAKGVYFVRAIVGSEQVMSRRILFLQ